MDDASDYGIHKYVCVLENMESIMCVPALVTCLRQLKRRGTSLSELVFYDHPLRRQDEVASNIPLQE